MDDGPDTAARAALPHEDRPPAPRPGGVPRGLLAALALATVVLAIAGWMALSTDTPTSGGAPDATGARPASQGVQVDLTGRPAPPTSFTTFDGPAASLADLRGSPVVVNFWGSWCPPCIREMPAFEQVHRAYGDRVRFVGLAVNDAETSARAQARMTGVSYLLGFDPDGLIGTSFGILDMPATVLIDRDGTVVHTSQAGALTAEQLTGLVEDKLRPAPAGEG
jgi:thiol-disulfide isomerase/thioredoxin